MHDPMCVAFDISVPIPRRQRWRETGDERRRARGEPVRRWTLGRRRRTNAENLGQPVWPWWRLRGYDPRVSGRAYGWRRLATVWHVEPRNRDAGEVCTQWRSGVDGRRGRPAHAWRWHVHHWHIQIHLTQTLKRWLWSRCAECGRRFPWGYAPTSHQWGGTGPRWFRGQEGVYHSECSLLRQERQTRQLHERLIRHLFAALRLAHDVDEPELLARITDPKGRALEFGEAYRLTRLLGYERDSEYRLVKKEAADA